MKFSRPIFFLLLSLIMGVGSLVAKPNREDSILLARIYSFQRNYTQEVRGFATNVYIKHLYQTHKRNATLWLIPSTYAIAKGRRTFVSEQYSRLYFRSVSDFDHLRQVYYTTIPRNRRTLPILMEFITPNVYGVTLYGDHILSPFCQENRAYYKYSTAYLGHGKMRLYFRPRIVPNTQLVKGKAIVNRSTGQIEQLEMEGEYDMIRFRTLTMQGDHGSRALLPKLCKTSIEFKFAGNHVTSDFTALFDCPITLPDSVDIRGDRQLIDSIRPISLSEPEAAVYQYYDSIYAKRPDTVQADTTTIDTTFVPLFKQELTPYTTLDEKEEDEPHRRRDLLKEIGWDLIGSNLLHSLKTQNENLYIKLSPILSPQYISYSSSKGITYKMRLNFEYKFTHDVWLKARPRLGYMFKRKEIYYEVPVWLYYSPKHEGTWYFNLSQDNRIGNSNVFDDIMEQMSGASPDEVADRQWHYFGDKMVQLMHSIRLNKQLTFSAGLTYHLRKEVHDRDLRRLGLTSTYKSLAPSLSLGWRPWPKAPLFTIDYERALTNKHLNIDYERWEADVSAKHRMSHLQMLNTRMGVGLYTRRVGYHFTDFANFRDNNLPEGWDDDWSGDFQLLDSYLYNASKYYVRGNISYESPLLGAYLVPLVGRYIERERFYWNALSIEHSRFYSEYGYGFTTRFFSMGLFASFLNFDYQQMTAKFTFELFRRW